MQETGYSLRGLISLMQEYAHAYDHVCIPGVTAGFLASRLTLTLQEFSGTNGSWPHTGGKFRLVFSWSSGLWASSGSPHVGKVLLKDSKQLDSPQLFWLYNVELIPW